MARTRRRGFTLTEIIVATALIAVLAALAIPGYRLQVLRAHRVEAVRSLLAAAAEQERFHLANGRYADRFGDDPATGAAGLATPAITDTGRYLLGVDEADAAGYRLWARPRPRGPQAADSTCALLSVDEAGRRAAQDAANHDTSLRCWR